MRSVRTQFFNLFLFGCLLLAACKVPPGIHDLFLDHAHPPAVTLDIVCDADVVGCTPSSSRSTVTALLPGLPPKSVVRVFACADDVVASRELYRVTTAVAKPNPNAERDQRKAETTQITNDVVRVTAPLFVPRHASPIAQTLHRVVLAGNPSGGTRHVVILTDGRQVSHGMSGRKSDDDPLGDVDFECGDIPDDFPDRLANLFPKDALHNVHIHFANVDLARVDHARCPDPDTTRYTRMRDVWVRGLSRQGAAVTWDMGPIGGLQ